MQRTHVFTVWMILSLFRVHSALATPSTTFWAPTTASCQDWAVPHITYDTYFDKGTPAGTQNSPNYPVDTGITVGFLPFDKIRGELGYDLLLPTQAPLLLNGKLCTPESSLFSGSPAASFGVFDLGFKTNVNDYNVLYFVIQKTIPRIGGYIALGIYRGLSSTLFTNSDGNRVSTGMLIAANSPELQIGLPGLKKITFAADVQTGKNILGAWGFGPYLYFTDNIDLLAGPVFFFDSKLQPGGVGHLWTLQLDVNVPLGSSKSR